MTKGFLKNLTTIICVLFIAGMMMVGPAFGQMYFEDNFSSQASLARWESAGGATWQIENGELVTRDSAGNWNVIVVKEEQWKGWTDYTYELTVTPERGLHIPHFIYQIFRYAQPASADRTNFLSYLMDEDNAKLHIDRFVNGTRTRGTDDLATTVTFEGSWKNDTPHTFKLDITKTNITGYVDNQKQFGPHNSANIADGRIGIGVWEADVRFDNVKVYGPGGPTPVEPTGKTATTWGRIKAKY